VSGPGLTNALTAIAEAYSNSFPMLVITTMNQTQELGMAGGCSTSCGRRATSSAR
jgi:acetolactate synthase-1/2/3 large subunit